MFTGIIQVIGEIGTISGNERFKQIMLPLPEVLLNGLVLGASVSIHGVCLTVTRLEGNTIYFDLGEETLQRTSLSRLQPGSKVNIERSLKMGDEMGGHCLSGHILAMATITQITSPTAEQRRLRVMCPSILMQYIFTKGYIALNGVSLTIGQVNQDSFDVHLIPETLQRTCFQYATVGEQINVEIDSQTLTLVETVRRLQQPK